jgi:alcohol dehydrogenase YqhD (iron-dependent ADH family)
MNYYTPTKVVFGKNSELEAGRLVAGFGGNRVLLHFGAAGGLNRQP